MSNESVRNPLNPGTKLFSVWCPPSPNEESPHWIIGRESVVDITVVHENGQMDTVPWALIEFLNGGRIMINLANAEGVRLLEDTPAEGGQDRPETMKDEKLQGICLAYDKGLCLGADGRDLPNPYPPASDEARAFQYGYSHGVKMPKSQNRPEPSEALAAMMRMRDWAWRGLGGKDANHQELAYLDADKETIRQALSQPAPAVPDSTYEALGWMYAECCAALDRGDDPRNIDCGSLIPKFQRDTGIAAAPTPADDGEQ